jgi:hypothetical protein
MRPSNAETSLPAWEKRKMLSMNSSVSVPVRVAEVLGHRQGRQGDAQTGARRFVHLAEHHAGLLDHAAAGVADLGFLHFQPEVVPFAGPFAHAGEDRVTAVALAIRAISSVRMTVLPRPAPPNRPALPPRTNGVSRSMTLMPVSNISVLVDRV